MKSNFILILLLFSSFISFSQNADSLSQKNDSAFNESDNIKQSIDEIPTVTLADEDLKESPPSNVASVLTASRDVFASTASYTFSIAHFRIRGYDAGHEVPLMNGAPMINLENNRGLYNDWSGLNDVVRARDISLGLAPATFSFGDIGGSYSIDSRASRQRKQLQVSYAISNRSYDNRIMLTYGSGILKNGWSYSVSGSRRWADEGYIPGTFYDGWSYFAGLEKMINTSHSLALNVFGAPTINGRSSPVTAEMHEIADDHYYNPKWGYQNGEKRNSVVGDRHEPTMILTHEWKLNTNSSLQSAVSYQFGKDKVSNLDWYNAPDPRPDYYRNLPSYLDSTDSLHTVMYDLLSKDETARQLNWARLYEVNEQNIDTITDANGISGNTVTGKRSLYVLRNYVTDNSRFTFNTIYNEALSDHFTLHGGVTYQVQSSEHYAEIKDLLGGDFYVDLNKFADTSSTNAGNPGSIQNDLNVPNRVLHVGDKYSYDYVAHISKSSSWMQGVFKYDKFDFFFALNASSNSFYRKGKYRNGVFPEDSYGNSDKQNFFSGGFKAGVTYKLNGRNYFYANGATISKAPEFVDAFISPNTRNAVIDNLRNASIQSIEGGYLLRAPKLKGRLTGYYTSFADETRISRWLMYGLGTSFVNFVMTDIDKVHTGIEAALDIDLSKGYSAYGVASVGQYYYTSRPNSSAILDNNDQVLFEDQKIYIKNLKVSGSPQSAYSVGGRYRSPHFWSVNANVNYFDNVYLDFSPARRRLAALDVIDQGSPLWNEILGQDKQDGQFTLDISGSWSWKINNKFPALKRNSFIVFNIGITNVLDNQDLVVRGYEQVRISPQGMETDLTKFPPKFSYANGRTFFASIILRMN
jgi:hypothetical protein